ARSMGAPGLALIELEEADRTGVGVAVARPQLIELYCDTGEPEKAQEVMSRGGLDDAALESEPGASAARQARVNFLLGFYESAARLWEDRGTSRLRFDRALRALSGTTTIIHGQPKAGTVMLLELPGKIDLQAAWEYDLGLCQLESGRPDLAAAP